MTVGLNENVNLRLTVGGAYGTAEIELFPGNLCKQISAALINTALLGITRREDACIN